MKHFAVSSSLLVNQYRYLSLIFVMAMLLTGMSPAFADKVNINKADSSALMTLKGIGEKRANAIIKYRKKNGNFSSAKDLLNVPGIGPEILKGIQRNLVTSGGLSTAPKAVSKTKATASKKTTSKSKDTKKATSDKKKSSTAKTKDAAKKKTSSKSKDKKKSTSSSSKSKTKSKSKSKTKKKKKSST